jgi:FlaA1/EpsC-like NDP-sugar epimerase
LNETVSERGVKRCLIIGAGTAGRAMARDLRHGAEFGLDPIGFLDDDPSRSSVDGIAILGTTAELQRVAAQYGVDCVIVAIPSLPPDEIDRLAAAALAAAVNVDYLPSFVAALERDVRISDLRPVPLDQLLGRREMQVVRSRSAADITGRRVLITGAGGSVGSELAGQLREFSPQELFLLDHDESNLHRLQLQLDGRALLDSNDLILADIRDRERIKHVIKDLRPEIVFHAAAHKHLPLLERHPGEGVKTNVLGTKHLVDASIAAGVDRFVLISSDKATDPISVLGATKRLAEIVLQANAGGPTTFASVRFGNVLGSRGSFLSVLAEQLENGLPVTVTHPDVARFFMTVEEAVGLVIEAASMAKKGETFVLDLGEPIRIVDLVRNYAEQLHVTEEDLTISYTGLRLGEKLEESLCGEHEHLVPTGHRSIWAIESSPITPDFFGGLDRLFELASTNDIAAILGQLAVLVPEYVPARATEPAQVTASPYLDEL